MLKTIQDKARHRTRPLWAWLKLLWQRIDEDNMTTLGQKRADQLPVLLCHLGDLPEPGQDHMVKFSQPIPSHKKTEASVHRNVSQTLQTV